MVWVIPCVVYKLLSPSHFYLSGQWTSALALFLYIPAFTIPPSRIGAIMLRHSSSVNIVASKGYYRVFITVDVRAVQASFLDKLSTCAFCFQYSAT